MGAQLSLWWSVPFAGMLLSIALFPILAPHWWHHHFPKVAVGWALLLASPFLYFYRGDALHEIVHVLVADYLPFVILLWALFTISGGIVIEGQLPGTPRTNMTLIALGAAIASFIGTTGASMLLIRPLLRANANRRYRVHTVVFFIFLVSNIGGSLTPLGDPPLFLGFLHGVPFFWTMQHIWMETAVAAAIVFSIYAVWETIQFRREKNRAELAAERSRGLAVRGLLNFLFMLGVLIAVLISGYWKPTHLQAGKWIKNGEFILPLAAIEDWLGHIPGAKPPHVAHQVDGRKMPDHPPADDHHAAPAKPNLADQPAPDHAGHGHQAHAAEVHIPVQNLVRDLLLIALGMLSLYFTGKDIRAANGFGWFPIKEVAWLFFGIFVTITPVIAILSSGADGHLAFVFRIVRTPTQYFWVTGILSSFLDNAPTYLTFFNTALGQFHAGLPEAEAVAKLLAGQGEYLAAISIGAVFMGANTYIGNAPNFMVRSIAEEANVRMPNFFAFPLLYAAPVLGPTFLLITWLFF